MQKQVTKELRCYWKIRVKGTPNCVHNIYSLEKGEIVQTKSIKTKMANIDHYQWSGRRAVVRIKSRKGWAFALKTDVKKFVGPHHKSRVGRLPWW